MDNCTAVASKQHEYLPPCYWKRINILATHFLINHPVHAAETIEINSQPGLFLDKEANVCGEMFNICPTVN
jgi:hypothetical protein